MGLSRTLVIFPLIVLTLLTILDTGAGLTVQNSGTPPSLANACQSSTVPNRSGLSCVISSSGEEVWTCDLVASGGVGCSMPYQCPNPLPQSTTCNTQNSGYTVWVIPSGFSISITPALQQTLVLVPPNTVNPNTKFLGISTTGFLILIVSASIIAVAAAVNVAASGENTEGVHIMWMVILLLGIWGILSASEGFITQSPNSFFVQLDGFFPGVGTLTYMFLTLLYCLGVIGSVSRSAGGGGGV